MKHIFSVIVAFVPCFASSGTAAAASTVNVTLSSDGFADAYQPGSLIPIVIYGACNNANGLFGAEVDVSSASQFLRVASFAADSAFASSHDSDTNGAELPADRIHVLRTQPMGCVDRQLGALGSPAPLATINLEVLSGEPFEAEVVVRARAFVIGESGAITTVMDSAPSAPGGFAEARFVVHSLGPAMPAEPDLPESQSSPAEPAEPQQVPIGQAVAAWPTADAAVSVDLCPPGTDDPATSLMVGQAYDLHYSAAAEPINNYTVFLVKDGPEGVTLDANSADTGTWATTGNFAYYDTAAQFGAAPRATGYPEGFRRYAMISDSIGSPADVGEGASGQGILCRIVPQSAGQLKLHVILNSADVEGEELVQMQTQLTLSVEAAG